MILYILATLSLIIGAILILAGTVIITTGIYNRKITDILTGSIIFGIGVLGAYFGNKYIEDVEYKKIEDDRYLQKLLKTQDFYNYLQSMITRANIPPETKRRLTDAIRKISEISDEFFSSTTSSPFGSIPLPTPQIS